jgi:hypothetical protein
MARGQDFKGLLDVSATLESGRIIRVPAPSLAPRNARCKARALSVGPSTAAKRIGHKVEVTAMACMMPLPESDSAFLSRLRTENPRPAVRCVSKALHTTCRMQRSTNQRIRAVSSAVGREGEI